MTLRLLHPHQRDALRYSLREDHPALFLEMRLGKSLVVVRRALLYRPGSALRGLRTLIVAPNSALGGWERELKLEKQGFIRLQGTKKRRLKALQDFSRNAGKPVWFLTNKESFLGIPEIRDRRWDCVVIDESHCIKNPKAKITKFFTRNFRDVPHRWVLTGTPNPESDLEFFEQIRFLDGKAFGFKNFWGFRAKCCACYDGFSWTPVPKAKEQMRKELGRRCLIMRRKDVGVFDERVEEVRELEFPKNIREIYRKIEKEFEIPGGRRTIWRMPQYQWLRQLCGGFLDGDFAWAGKLGELGSLLQGELRRDSVVVWFNYNPEVFRATAYLEEKRVSVANITGKVSVRMRDRTVRQFQKGKIRVLLLQQAIGQAGLDLSRADTAIYYSEPPGRIALEQTRDRILDIKQERTLLYVYLTVKDTVDQDIHEAGKLKGEAGEMTLNEALKYAMQKRRKKYGS